MILINRKDYSIVQILWRIIFKNTNNCFRGFYSVYLRKLAAYSFLLFTSRVSINSNKPCSLIYLPFYCFRFPLYQRINIFVYSNTETARDLEQCYKHTISISPSENQILSYITFSLQSWFVCRGSKRQSSETQRSSSKLFLDSPVYTLLRGCMLYVLTFRALQF